MTKQRAEASALSRPLTRRQFLRTSASALAVPHVISPSSMGLAGTVAPSERITIGMIGLGRQTIAYNLPFFLSQPDAQVVALCDVDRYRLDLNDQREIVLYGRKRTWQHGHLANCTRYTDFRELLARIRSNLRRVSYNQQTAGETGVGIFALGPLTINRERRQVIRNDVLVPLSHREFDLFSALLDAGGAVVTRSDLLDQVWGEEWIGDPRTLDVHIRWCREKLEEDPSSPHLILTVRGVGYRLISPDEL